MIARQQNFVTVHPDILQEAIEKRTWRTLEFVMHGTVVSNFCGRLPKTKETIERLMKQTGLCERTVMRRIEECLEQKRMTQSGTTYYILPLVKRPARRKKKTGMHHRIPIDMIGDARTYYLLSRVNSIQFANYRTLTESDRTLPKVSYSVFCADPIGYLMLGMRINKKPGYHPSVGELHTLASVSRSLLAQLASRSSATIKRWKKRAEALGYLSVHSSVHTRTYETPGEAENARAMFAMERPEHAPRFRAEGNKLHIQCTDRLLVTVPMVLTHADNIEKNGIRFGGSGTRLIYDN